MGELFAACITTLDIVVVYALLQIKGRKFALVLWTTFLNMVLPFLGFLAGEFSSSIFTGWSHLLSGVLLALIGLHMLLHDENTESPTRKIHPAIIAFAVSIDAFSVSVSFGMLHFNKVLFITATSLFSFTLSIAVLYFKGRIGFKFGKFIRRFAGLSLLVMGVLSCIR